MEASLKKLKELLSEMESIMSDNSAIEIEIEKLAAIEENLQKEWNNLESEKEQKYKQIYSIFGSHSHK